MVGGTFMLQLLLLLLLLKQSYGVNEECSELNEEILGLEEHIKKITQKKHEYEQGYGKCKVSK